MSFNYPEKWLKLLSWNPLLHFCAQTCIIDFDNLTLTAQYTHSRIEEQIINTVDLLLILFFSFFSVYAKSGRCSTYVSVVFNLVSVREMTVRLVDPLPPLACHWMVCASSIVINSRVGFCHGPVIEPARGRKASLCVRDTCISELDDLFCTKQMCLPEKIDREQCIFMLAFTVV